MDERRRRPAPGASRRCAARRALRRGGQRAFSLVETLVAMLLVTLSMLGLGALQLTSLRGSGTSLDLLAAASHAISHEERVRALHDAPPAARAQLLGTGAPVGCSADRRCAPDEFAADEAARWLDAGGPRSWQPVAPAPADEAPAFRVRLQVRRADAPFVDVDVVS